MRSETMSKEEGMDAEKGGNGVIKEERKDK
jgi:hypothetical protein